MNASPAPVHGFASRCATTPCARMTLPVGTWVVPGRQELALVAAIMLEPQSDDGFTTWNFLDPQLTVGGAHPVRRALAPIPLPAAR